MPENRAPVNDPLPVRLVDRLNLALAALGGVAAAGLLTTILVNVVSRKFFDVPLSGTLDLSAYLWMPVLTSLAMGYALQKHEHVRVSLITENARPLTQQVVEVFSLVLTVCLIGLLAVFTFSDAMTQRGFNEHATGTPWLPVWPLRFVVAVGVAGLALQSLAECVRALRPGVVAGTPTSPSCRAE